jgi:hypothetical protein
MRITRKTCDWSGELATAGRANAGGALLILITEHRSGRGRSKGKILLSAVRTSSRPISLTRNTPVFPVIRTTVGWVRGCVWAAVGGGTGRLGRGCIAVRGQAPRPQARGRTRCASLQVDLTETPSRAAMSAIIAILRSRWQSRWLAALRALTPLSECGGVPLCKSRPAIWNPGPRVPCRATVASSLFASGP